MIETMCIDKRIEYVYASETAIGQQHKIDTHTHTQRNASHHGSHSASANVYIYADNQSHTLNNARKETQTFENYLTFFLLCFFFFYRSAAFFFFAVFFLFVSLCFSRRFFGLFSNSNSYVCVCVFFMHFDYSYCTFYSWAVCARLAIFKMTPWKYIKMKKKKNRLPTHTHTHTMHLFV